MGHHHTGPGVGTGAALGTAAGVGGAEMAHHHNHGNMGNQVRPSLIRAGSIGINKYGSNLCLKAA